MSQQFTRLIGFVMVAFCLVILPDAVDHIGYGQGIVKKFASNRRVLGANGKVQYQRGSTTPNPVARSKPEGTIDPNVRLVSFWNEEVPLVSMTYYTTHPQSYYGRGGVSADTVGLARSAREEALPQVTHIHFNGAGGNIAAGKYNDGATKNRAIFGERLTIGMTAAFKTIKKFPVSTADVNWRTRQVKLPIKKTLDREKIINVLDNPKSSRHNLIRACRQLAWMNRCEAGHKITISCLTLGPIRILHMPGELFIEYQLAAQQMRPDLFVCMAAYADHGSGYLCTKMHIPRVATNPDHHQTPPLKWKMF